MDKEFQKKMGERLEQELQVLIKELRSIGRVNPENPKDWEAVPDKMDVLSSDPNEVADSIESYEENTAILKQLEIKLNETKEALGRIKEGTYGMCGVCGKAIETARLEANPSSKTCLAHKDT